MWKRQIRLQSSEGEKAIHLWKVERTDGCGYDEFDAFIVAAKTEAEARRTHPYGDKWSADEGGWEYASSWPVKPEDVTVMKIGRAARGIKSGTVLLASFHAG